MSVAAAFLAKTQDAKYVTLNVSHSGIETMLYNYMYTTRNIHPLETSI